ncbi:hypothetical protein [Paracoccus sp. 22332]|uniref:hypothetical protein n=1 Tax=Paracoccus sp. 22332 TaxID=3453913 RepID=UPI003F82E0F4
MTNLPTTGGSYTRDMLTGALVRQPDGPVSEPEPQPETPTRSTPTRPKAGN